MQIHFVEYTIINKQDQMSVYHELSVQCLRVKEKLHKVYYCTADRACFSIGPHAH